MSLPDYIEYTATRHAGWAWRCHRCNRNRFGAATQGTAQMEAKQHARDVHGWQEPEQEPTAMDVLRFLVENEDQPCRLDHHGLCQEHGLSQPPCATAMGRRLLGLPNSLGAPSPVTTQEDR